MKNIYQQAVDTFGKESQYRKAIEECNKLASKIAHYQDNKCTAADVAGEIADGEIMCEQLRLLIHDGVFLVHQQKAAKIARLEQIVHDEQLQKSHGLGSCSDFCADVFFTQVGGGIR